MDGGGEAAYIIKICPRSGFTHMAPNKPIPIWIYRPRDTEARKAKYAYALKQGCNKDQARRLRDYDWPRVYWEVREIKRQNAKAGAVRNH